MVFWRVKILQKIKSENIKDVKKNWITILILLLCMFVNYLMSRIKNCRGEKGGGKKKTDFLGVN